MYVPNVIMYLIRNLVSKSRIDREKKNWKKEEKNISLSIYIYNRYIYALKTSDYAAILFIIYL